ncbi:MAG: tetratricopeptide repeat protein [Pseudomonadota bacterium]
MSIYVISLVFQALLIVHCVKTGRSQIWIWVLALLPIVGVIAYVAAELIPDLLRSRTTQRTVKGVRKALDPQADLRRLEGKAQLTGGVDANQRLAEELLRQNRTGDAIAAYQQCLKGLYEHDPNLMLGLANAQFAHGDAAATRATLDDLIRFNPEYKSPAGHLLYARALESEGNLPRALEEYSALAAYFPGAEAAVRYAQLLRRQQQTDQARKVLQDLTDQATASPEHYRRTQADWLKQAQRELAELRGLS